MHVYADCCVIIADALNQISNLLHWVYTCCSTGFLVGFTTVLFIHLTCTFELSKDLLHHNKRLIIHRWNSCSGVFWSLDWFSMSEVVNKKMWRSGRLSHLWIQQIQVSDTQGNKRWVFTTSKTVFPLLAPAILTSYFPPPPRIIFLSLITCLSGCSYFFLIAVILVLRRQAAKPEAAAQPANAAKEMELHSPPDPSKGHLKAVEGQEEGK